MHLLMMLMNFPIKKNRNVSNRKSINQLTIVNFFSNKSWFISARETKLNNDESCWLIFDKCLSCLLKFPIANNGDDVGLWRKNDDEDDAAGILINVDNGVNSTDADLFVIDEL